MYKLDDSQDIQYEVFGIGKDHLDIGTWDDSNGASEKLTMFRTKDTSSWDVLFSSSSVQYSGNKKEIATTQSVLIDPSYPWIALDKSTFTEFRKHFAELTKSLEDEWECDLANCYA